MNNKNVLIGAGALILIVYLSVTFRGNKSPSLPETNNESINEKLAWIYEGDAKTLSNLDVQVLLRWGKHGQKWNLATAPIIRDFMDQSVSPEEFIKTSNVHLRSMRAIVYEMGVDANVIQDAKVRTRLNKVFNIHKEGITIYEKLHNAVVTQDEQSQRDSLVNLENWGKRKMELVKPTIDRLAEKLPNQIVDETINRMRSEIADELDK